MLHFLFIFIIDQRVDILVRTAVTGHQSSLHSHGIDKEFERRTWLMLGTHLVILPRVKVHIADPCLDMAVARFHGYESAVHEVQHVAHRVHRTHLHVERVVLVVKQVHHVGLVHVIIDGVQIIGVTRQQLMIDGRVASLVLDKACNGLVVVVQPAVLCSPVALEVLLNHLHLLAHRLLGILLHFGVKRGVDL